MKILCRNIAYLFLFLLDKILRRTPEVTILCYHSIGDGWYYSVSLEEFTRQINELRKQKYTFVSLCDIEEYLRGDKKLPHRSVAITFDDGYRDLLAIKSLPQSGVPVTLFMLTAPDRLDREEMGNDLPLLSWDEVRTLCDNGWEIGNHGATHTNLWKTSDLDFELRHSKTIIEKETARKVKYFAYPKGRYTPFILQKMCDLGYTMALSMDQYPLESKKTDLYAVPRVGIDTTHKGILFLATMSPSVVSFRRMLTQKFKIQT